MTGSSRGNSFWYGYLVAGENSSPVLRDDQLDTGNRKTVYLFNLRRGEIIEYELQTVGMKLRDLQPDESGSVAELKAAYKKARRSFKARGDRERSYKEAKIIPLRTANARPDYNAEPDDSDLWLESDEA